jgi:hypothetical protein
LSSVQRGILIIKRCPIFPKPSIPTFQYSNIPTFQLGAKRTKFIKTIFFTYPVHQPDKIPNFTKTPHISIIIVRMKKKYRSVFLLK